MGLKYINTAKGGQLSYFYELKNELKLCYLREKIDTGRLLRKGVFMKKIKAIADHYGKEHQTIKAIEELAELIQALAKGDIENIKEEIADEELQKRLAEELKKYEPYWKDCILIYAAR